MTADAKTIKSNFKLFDNNFLSPNQ